MLLSKKNREILLGPLSRNNPVIVQVLGICSALAVTAKLEPAFVMAISVTAVLAFSNVIIWWSLRRWSSSSTRCSKPMLMT